AGAWRLSVRVRLRSARLGGECALQGCQTARQNAPAVPGARESLAATDAHLYSLCARSLPEWTRVRGFPLCGLWRVYGNLAGTRVHAGSGAICPGLLSTPGADQAIAQYQLWRCTSAG